MNNRILPQNNNSVNISVEEKKESFGWIKWPKEKTSVSGPIKNYINNRFNSSRDITIQKFKRDTIIRHSFPEPDDKFFSDVVKSSHFEPTKPVESKRGLITGLSRKSHSRSKHYLRNLPDTFKWIMGLTFPDIPKDGLTVKRAREVFMKRLRRAFPDIGYFWVREWQRRGSAHFHIVVDVDVPEIWIKSNWFDIVGDGYINAMIVGAVMQPIRKTVAHYLSDYMSKKYQKTPPEDYINIGRFWGCSRDLLEVIEEKIKNAPYPVIARCFRVARKAYLHRLKECGIKYSHNSWASLRLNDIALPGRCKFQDFIGGQWLAYLDNELMTFNPDEVYTEYRPFIVSMTKKILVYLLAGGNKKQTTINKRR
jgi:hypothetical protein